MRKRHKKLFFRLYTYFIIVILVPLFFIGIFTFYGASEKLQDQAEANLTQVINIAAHHLEQYIHSYENSTLSLLTNADIKEYLDLDPKLNYEKYYYTSRIKEFAFEPILIRHPEVMALYVIGQDGRAVSMNNRERIDYLGPSSEADFSSFFNAVPDSGQLVILNTSAIADRAGQYITLARKIQGRSSTQLKGVIAMEVRSTDLSSLWRGINLGDMGVFQIQDKDGIILYHSDSSYIGKHYSMIEGKVLPEDQVVSFTSSEDGEKRFHIARHSSYTDWNLMMSIPMDELRAPINGIRTDMIWIVTVTLLIGLLIAYRFGYSVVAPIQHLRKGMQRAEKGEWTRIPLSGKLDEVDELIVSYNSMVHKLSELIEQVYAAENTKREAELERQKAELQALQLQINPHFLYNTLETIVCYPSVQDSEEVSEIVKHMSLMLRYAVQTSLEEITVANELKHVLNYMAILQHRIGKEFEIEVEIPPDCLLNKMVRLTLQPLIENVFQHAFFEGIEEHHRIQIQAYETENTFVVTVVDNGKGMSEETLLQLRSRLETKRLTEIKEGMGGIGVLNVHRRIQLVFGEAYGLQIESEWGAGTRIRMIMPKS